MKKQSKIAILFLTFAMVVALLVVPTSAASTTMNTADFVGAIITRFYSEMSGKSYAEQVAALDENGVITAPEHDLLNQEKCPRSMMWRILLPLFDAYPAPAALVAPEIPVINGCEGQYHDARVSAYVYGLTTEKQMNAPTYRASAKEFQELWENLANGNYTIPTMPGEDSIPYLADVALTKDTVEGRNALLVSYPKLKNTLGKYLDRFESNGWTYQVAAHVDQAAGETAWTKEVPAGLCVYGQKRIYLNHASSKTVWHEFAHYLAYDLDMNDTLTKAFEREGKAAHTVLGDYSQTNSHEFWAEAFGKYFDSPSIRSDLKTAAPLTTALIEDVILGSADGEYVNQEALAQVQAALQ